MRVSVVVPTCNRAHQIGDTIRSVLAQSHPPLEVLIVDDGSTDATEEVCSGFGSAVRYIRQPNGGVSVARNNGAAQASGDLVAFVDSDDLWHPRKLELQVAALDEYPEAGWSISGCEIIDLSGAVIPTKPGYLWAFDVFATTGIAPHEFFPKYLERRSLVVNGTDHPAYVGDPFLPLFLGNFALPSSAMIRRTAFEAAGGFDPAFRLAEETEFFHRLAARSPVVLLDMPLAGYRIGQAGSLISPANTVTLIENAIVSGQRARRLRHSTPELDRHFTRGQRMLLRKLAYAKLSLGAGRQARDAVWNGWRSGVIPDAATLGIYGASWLPRRALDVAARLKARARGRLRQSTTPANSSLV